LGEVRRDQCVEVKKTAEEKGENERTVKDNTGSVRKLSKKSLANFTWPKGLARIMVVGKGRPERKGENPREKGTLGEIGARKENITRASYDGKDQSWVRDFTWRAPSTTVKKKKKKN